MRVTVSMTYQKMILNLNRKAEDADRLSTMIASNKRISKPQEDPQAWSQAMGLKQGLRELDAYQKNVDFAIAWNQTTVNALNSFSGLLDQAIQVATAAIGNSEDRATQINTIDNISQQALALANTQYQDLYVFSGRKLSTAPFDATTLDYQGDTQDFEVRAGKNDLQAININGQSAFIQDASDPDGSNILKRLAALKAALQSEDMTEVRNQTVALESAQKYIRAENSLAGLRLSSLNDQKSSLKTLKLNDTNQLSQLEDTNMAEAITQLQQNQTALQAALQVTSMLKDLNLANYL
jgi:flagellar hook-associated protein 3 FlgL